MARRANRKKVRPQVTKPRKHETLEDRVVMSADPLGGPMMTTHGFAPTDEVPTFTHHGSVHTTVETAPVHDPGADFWRGTEEAFGSDVDDIGRRIEQTLAQAHDLTGQDHVVSKYGFDGAGQTVAVLDTGIAYGHYALGGGVGDGYRIVGGYDFTENDSDFYDDGPRGGHGTHVAGIVGADGDGSHSGVATGVDLVGLRVFDDAGNGYFSWVESALNWVYDNRNAFNNPITAINLSLGTTWNSDSIPSWAMLEDEFTKLENAGIFIAVSAGNSYQDYNSNGVSYPAASDHVIPVMATYNSGSLANFSQRATYAIAAPGVGITSTVPDYAANDGDTIDDDWLGMSGTSMASPYVAGASVLIREAMEFVGQTGVDQWDIYNHMMSTADSFFDSASQETYKRLNLEAAIDALMPEDDYGSTIALAHSLGSVGEGSGPSLSGVISTLDDADNFTFTAGVTGTVTISASNVTHNLVSQWDAWGGTWEIDADGNCVIDVVAGQTYTFALSSSDGLGYYDISMTAESGFDGIVWAQLEQGQQTQTGLSVVGEMWHQVTASRDGHFTVQLLDSNAAIEVYDDQSNLLASGSSRLDVQVNEGDTLLLRVAGNDADYGVRITNALSVNGSVASFVGTSGADTFTFTSGSTDNRVVFNGVAYDLDASTISTVQIEGDAADSLTLTGSSQTEQFSLGNGGASLTRSGLTMSATGFGSVIATAGSSSDAININDTASDDTLTTWSDRAVINGGGFFGDARGFGRVVATSSGGFDIVTIHDTAGDEVFNAWSDRAVMNGAGFVVDARGFDRVFAYASGGHDVASLRDTAGDEVFSAWSDRAVMNSSSYVIDARGFDKVTGYATLGSDEARLYDTDGDEFFTLWSDRAVMSGDDYTNDLRGFDRVIAHSTGGRDLAWLHDTAGDEIFTAWWDRTVISGAGFTNDLRGFDQVVGYSTGGNDQARMFDSAGSDVFTAWWDRAVMSGSNYLTDFRGFSQVVATATSGADQARLYDTAGDEFFTAWSDRGVMKGSNFLNDARGFDQVIAYATGGFDEARMYDTPANDTFLTWSERAVMRGAGYNNDLRGFDRVIGYGTGGFDYAWLTADESGSSVTADNIGAVLTMPTGVAEARGFERVTADLADATAGNAEIDESVDYAFELWGDWADA
ncbi:MAG: S8 family serine peptidase [Planctomycetota bacterium]